MADRGAHDRFGGIVGGAAAAFAARNEDPLSLLAETVGGYLGGRVASRLPDVFEPATSSWHRGVAHSVLVAGGGAVAVHRAGGGIAALARRASVEERALWQDRTRPTWDRVVAFLADMLLRLVVGAVNTLGIGYGSHLVLDALTPRGLPVLG